MGARIGVRCIGGQSPNPEGEEEGATVHCLLKAERILMEAVAGAFLRKDSGGGPVGRFTWE